PHCVIAFVLMKDGRHGEDDEIIAVCFVNETAPVIAPETGHAFAELRVRVLRLGYSRSESSKDEGRVIEAVLGSNFEGFQRSGRRGNCAGADGTVIRHDTQDALRLLLGGWNHFSIGLNLIRWLRVGAVGGDSRLGRLLLIFRLLRECAGSTQSKEQKHGMVSVHLFLIVANGLGSDTGLVGRALEIGIASGREITTVQDLWEEYWNSVGLPRNFQDFEEEQKSLPGRYAPPKGRLLLAV